ncbi:serine hydrolase [Ancylobacter pratisalsi]|uniref:Serine hydrolase n=1 Tax=Ancylobacter pratisalsi TaxID=1745854 RepID=A0A6P1YT79_9HYPH|nr:serine hydrolase [Ancylobacter pratisalsi]
MKGQWASDHVPIADLTSHRSGLSDHGGDNPEDIGFDRRAVLELGRFLPLDSFRISYADTNFGFTAGAEAVAVAAGKDWATLSEDALYTPPGTTSTNSRLLVRCFRHAAPSSGGGGWSSNISRAMRRPIRRASFVTERPILSSFRACRSKPPIFSAPIRSPRLR